MAYQVPLRTATGWRASFKAAETHPDADKSMRSEPTGGHWKRDFVDGFIAEFLRTNAFTIKAQPAPNVEAQLELSVDPFNPVEFYAVFVTYWEDNKKYLDEAQRAKPMSDSTVAKRWAARMKSEEEGVPKLRCRSMRGEDNGCKTCCLLYLKHKKAKGKEDKAYWRRQRQLHREYYIGERKFNEEWVNEAIADLNILSLITDGFDTFKSTLPIVSEAPGGDLGKLRKYFYVLKLQGTIIHDHLFMHTIYHPWIAGGANALCTAVLQALRLRWTREAGGTTVPAPGKICYMTVDGGHENWNRATWCFFAWLVLIFEGGVYVHRMPTKHTEASIDRNFQAGSVWFYGCRGGKRGLMCATLAEFFTGYKKAYEGRETTKFGGEVQLQEVGVVWDWWAYFKPYMHKHFKGIGHAKKQWVNEHGFVEEGNKGSMVHFLHFFKGSDDNIYLRYKTRARVAKWMPEGADGVRNIGRKPFKVKASELPTTEPGLAAFCPKWAKKLPKVRETVLSINSKCGDVYQSDVQRQSWVQHFDNIPSSPDTVVQEMRPIWWFAGASASASGSASGSTAVSMLGVEHGCRAWVWSMWHGCWSTRVQHGCKHGCAHGCDIGVAWVLEHARAAWV